MDSVANLKEQLEIAREIEHTWNLGNDDGTLGADQMERVAALADRLSELVLALDEWQRKGGFSPYEKGGK